MTARKYSPLRGMSASEPDVWMFCLAISPGGPNPPKNTNQPASVAAPAAHASSIGSRQAALSVAGRHPRERSISPIRHSPIAAGTATMYCRLDTATANAIEADHHRPRLAATRPANAAPAAIMSVYRCTPTPIR